MRKTVSVQCESKNCHSSINRLRELDQVGCGTSEARKSAHTRLDGTRPVDPLIDPEIKSCRESRKEVGIIEGRSEDFIGRQRGKYVG